MPHTDLIPCHIFQQDKKYYHDVNTVNEGNEILLKAMFPFSVHLLLSLLILAL